MSYQMCPRLLLLEEHRFIVLFLLKMVQHVLYLLIPVTTDELFYKDLVNVDKCLVTTLKVVHLTVVVFLFF